jgi:hypothetical protein
VSPTALAPCPVLNTARSNSLATNLGERGAGDVSGESHRAGSLSGAEYCTGRHFLHVFEELRLGGAGVTAQQHVDVTTHLNIYKYLI